VSVATLVIIVSPTREPSAFWVPKLPLRQSTPRTNCPIGRSIRRLYLDVAHHRPQSLAPLEPLSASPFGLGHPTGLARFQPPLHFAPDRPPIRGIARRSQRPVTDAVPPGIVGGPAPPMLRHSRGSLPCACALLRRRATDVPTTPTAAREGTRDWRSRGPWLNSPRSVLPGVPRPPCHRTTVDSHTVTPAVTLGYSQARGRPSHQSVSPGRR
jgi:hypothetical protein